VSLETPSKLNIKLELFIPPYGCEAPTCGCETPTTTIPNPNSIQRGFSQWPTARPMWEYLQMLQNINKVVLVEEKKRRHLALEDMLV
jgi:hypothetical protein